MSQEEGPEEHEILEFEEVDAEEPGPQQAEPAWELEFSEDDDVDDSEADDFLDEVDEMDLDEAWDEEVGNRCCSKHRCCSCLGTSHAG